MKIGFSLLIVALLSAVACPCFGPVASHAQDRHRNTWTAFRAFLRQYQGQAVRLRPGTNTPITITDIDFFVQQQYIDFLGRMPDSTGFANWVRR
jgi:hypothetical protein